MRAKQARLFNSLGIGLKCWMSKLIKNKTILNLHLLRMMLHDYYRVKPIEEYWAIVRSPRRTNHGICAATRTWIGKIIDGQMDESSNVMQEFVLFVYRTILHSVFSGQRVAIFRYFTCIPAFQFSFSQFLTIYLSIQSSNCPRMVTGTTNIKYDTWTLRSLAHIKSY